MLNKIINNAALIIDNEKLFIDLYKPILNAFGLKKIFTSTNDKKIMTILDKESVNIIIFDIAKSFLDGIDLLTAIKLLYPEVPIIIVTNELDIKVALNCVKKGAFDYIEKNTDEYKLRKVIKSALNYQYTSDEVSRLRSDISYLMNIKHNIKLKDNTAFSELITNSDYMFSVFAYCEAIAKTKNTVFIKGDTGTGKELIARAIHKSSKRTGGFVACNIAGFDDQMLSDALFGHVKGAFTGAVSKRTGLVDKANGGTLFLDEIGDLNLSSQVKLLRLLQEREYTPLGSDEIKTSDIQIVVATNRDIKEMCSKKVFRKDLYFRLMTHCIELPGLKDRKNDIPLLFDYFLKNTAHRLNIKIPTYHQSLVHMLQLYDYPGNIRELKNMIEDALVNHTSKMLSGKIFQKHINRSKFNEGYEDRISLSIEGLISQLDELPGIKKFADMLVCEAMKRTGDNQTLAAKMLGISHQAFNRRLKNME